MKPIIKEKKSKFILKTTAGELPEVAFTCVSQFEQEEM